MSTATWSAIYLGTIADIDPDESLKPAENAALLKRTWGSAADPLFHHVTPIAATTDEDPLIELDSHQIGAKDTISYDRGTGPVTTEVDAGALVAGVITFHDGTTYSSNFAVIQDRTGAVFLLISDTDATLASKAIDTLTVNTIIKTDYDGVELLTRDELSFVCFADGTRILTPAGERAVEDLAEGDLVLTLDHGAQAIRWIGRRRAALRPGLCRDRPVGIAPGALGGGAPLRALTLSPRHRVMLRAEDARAGAAERLCAACFLEDLPGIARRMDLAAVGYHALLLDRHEVLIAEGAPVESFHPGPYARRMLGAALRAQIAARFPALADPQAHPGPLARSDMKRGEARRLVERIGKGRARLLGRPDAGTGAPRRAVCAAVTGAAARP